MVHISDVQSPIFCLFNNAIFTMIVWEKVVHFLFWCEPQIVTFWNYTFSWTTFFLLQEINVVHISDVVRPIFCLSNDTTFIKIHKQKVVQFLFNVNHMLSWFWRRFSTYFHEPHSFAYKKLMWFTYHTWNSKSFGFPTKLFSLWWSKWKWFIFHFKQARPNVLSP